ncbi:MAG TPA: ATP-binding protein [Anaerolineales bacterium]|nr:ATP-binding protein [Anaerolineales bacterium]
MINRFRNWASTPIIEDENKSLSANLLNLIIWILVISTSLYGIIAPVEPEFLNQRLFFIIPYILINLVAKQLLNNGYIDLVGHFIVICLWGVITSALFVGADNKNPAFMGYIVVVTCAGLVLNRKAAILWALISIITSALILQFGILGFLPRSANETPAFAFWSAQALYIAVCSMLLTQTLQKIEEARNRAQKELLERKRVEAERERIIGELEMKNAELERFTYTVSHDLKSPLITIGGFIGLLEKDTLNGDVNRLKNDLEKIREAKDKMARLLDELLELSRIGRVKNPSGEFSLKQIVDEAVTLVQGRITSGRVQVIIHEPLPMLYCDGPRLVEVMQNLLDNAAKFMGDQPTPRIDISARKDADEIIVYVKDNGMGINPIFHTKIFNLFDKLDPKSEGTGAGLALVKRIIEVHEGRIWVESDGAGTGSCFCFTLPAKT